ncbi:MAG: GNAT family N-acetyltransferase [Proteobacteria bacterium]|jgi:ribosomal protein S18 acetylase RimI-like enzyme|nr:GNAT family N-acetyltransferase [Pseudomonadota bacterium]
MLLKMIDDDLALHHVQHAGHMWIDRFAVTYQRIFAGEPYLEHFTLDEAREAYRKLTNTPNNITLIIADKRNTVVAFAIAIPIRFKYSVASELSGLVPLNHTMYLAELGVLPTHRGRGMGRQLVMHRLKLIDRNNFTHVVLRVSELREAYLLYEGLGFEDMGVWMEVTSKRVDGTVGTDRRLFMSRVLSQVPIP